MSVSAFRPRPRTLVAPAETQLTAVLQHPVLWQLAALVPEHDTGAPRRNAAWSYLFFGAAARIFRSAARAEAELRTPHLWNLVCAQAEAMQDQLPAGSWSPAPSRPVRATAFEWARKTTLCSPDVLPLLMSQFTALAVPRAQSVLGLLRPDGPGSWTHPHPTRALFGDGTLIRSIYRPPPTVWVPGPDGAIVLRYKGRDGTLLERPDRRFDPDIAEHHGKTGPVQGHNMVTIHATGTARMQRYLLGFDIAAAGHEADTGTALALAIIRVAGPGAVQALVWDLAIRGVHADALMTRGGILVVTKVVDPPGTYPSPSTGARGAAQTVAGESDPRTLAVVGRLPRSMPLGTATHTGSTGRTCSHILATVGGQVCQVQLDDAGDPHPDPLECRQVKRARRAEGTFHFSVAYTVPCRHGDFTTWVNPHSTPTDPGHRRAENMRVIPPKDDRFAAIFGIREESESSHSLYKRSILYDRAPYLGRERLLLDQLCWALAHNALTEYRLQHLPTRLVPARTGRAGH